MSNARTIADYANDDGISGNKIDGGTISSSALATTVTMSANHPGVKAALNASGNPGICACRAWVNYNSSTNSINASFNVSSVTDATGNLVVNFTTAMQDANYSVQVTAGAGPGLFHERVDNLATGSFRIYTYRNNGALTDYNPTCAAVFR